MTAPTHSVFGLLTAAVIFSVMSVPIFKDLPGLIIVILGSLLPDIDTHRSFLGRLLGFISRHVEERWGHRSATHSLLALTVVGLAFAPLFFVSGVWWLCIVLGYLSHLLIDSVNKRGTPLLWPSPAFCVFPKNERFRIRTGNFRSEGPLLVVFLLLLGFFMPVSNLGLIRTFRWLAATQRSAYAEYRASSTETLLEFRGLYRESRQPVEGTTPVLEADPQQFVVYLGNRAVKVGEKGEIVPKKSRIVILKTPLDYRKQHFKNAPLSDIIRTAGSSLVNGSLQSSGAVECFSSSPSVYANGSELVLDWADSAALSQALIMQKWDSEALAVFESDLAFIENEILTLENDLPSNRKAGLEYSLASLEARRVLLVKNLSTETGIMARLDLQEEIQTIHQVKLRLRMDINTLNLSDPSVPLKIERARLKQSRLKHRYGQISGDEVLFSGELVFRGL